MLTRDTMLLDQGLIVIDLSQVNLHDKCNYIESKAETNKWIVCVGDNISIHLLEHNTDYEIIFGKVNIDDCFITVVGGNNNILISNSNIHCNSIELNCGSFTLDSDSHFKTQLTRINVKQAEINGSIESTHMVANITAGEPGVSIYGELTLADTYIQHHGSFENYNIFKSHQYLIDNGVAIANHEGASWIISNAQEIKGESFINKGEISAKHSSLNCENILIKNDTLEAKVTFTGETAVLNGSEMVLIANSIDCSIDNLLCQSKQTVILEGQFHNSSLIQALADNIQVASTAKFEECVDIKLKALSLLQCEGGVITRKVSNIVAAAKRIHMGSSLTVDSNIMLVGAQYSLIKQDVILTSPHVTILSPGADVLIYGAVSGQVIFPEKIRHLYLPKNSKIEKSSSLNVESIFIQAYGDVQSNLHSFIAQSSIFTDTTTVVDGTSIAMISEFIRLSGKLSGKELYCKSNLQISMTPQLSVTTEKLIADSRAIRMMGAINGSVDLASNDLINQATIINDSHAIFHVEGCQVHLPLSVIQTKDVQMIGKEIINHGSFTSSHSIHEQACDIYNGKESILSTPETIIQSDNILQGGKITDGTKVNITASKACGFLATNQIRSTDISIHAGDQLAGPLNLNADNAVASGHHHVDLISGNIVARKSLTVGSRELLLDSMITTKNLILTEIRKTEDNNDSYAKIGSHSTIKTKEFAVNIANVTMSGMLDADKAIFESRSAITIEADACLIITHQMSAKTQTLEFSGKLTSACKSTRENDGIYVEATHANFESYSSIILPIPMYVRSDDVRYAGHLEAITLTSQADDTFFDSGCNIPGTTSVVNIEGQSPSAIVTVGRAVNIQSQSFRASNVDKFKVSGIITSNKILIKVNEIHIDLHGQLGDDDSVLSLVSDTLKLDGLLQGSEANIKCHLLFLQNWLQGRATLRVHKLNLTAPFYINFLGRTESQHASFTSLLYLCFGFEFINFKTNNTVVKLNVLPKLVHVEYLTNIIADIKDGKVDIFSVNYLQSTLQTILAILQPFLPTVTLAANIGFNAYFMANNIPQLVGMVRSLSEMKDIQLVDLLPLLVTIKNIVTTGKLLVDNVGTFIDVVKYPVLDAVEDIGNYLDNDFLKDIKDKFHKHQDKNDNDHPSSVQTEPANKQSNTTTKKDDDLPVTSKLDEFKKWVHDIKPIDAAHDVFTKGLMAPLSILLPSSFEDALINIDLFSPILTGTSNQRGIFTFSFCSPVTGISSNKTGVLALVDSSRHFVYAESMSGHYVFKGQDSQAHIFNLHDAQFEQANGTKISPAHALVDEKHARPHNISASKSLTFKYETVDNEMDFLQLKSIYDVYRPEGDNKPLISYDTNHALKFYQSFTLPWSVSFKGSDVFVNHGVIIKSLADTVGLVSSKGDIIMNGKLASNKRIFMSSSGKIDQKNGTTDSKQLYLSARHNIDSIRSHNTADEGAIISFRGRVMVEAGKVKFKDFGYISAHKDVVASCQSSTTTHNKSPDKEYTPGVIEGGDGLHHDKVGLVVHSGNKIINQGSYIGAKGDYLLDGVHGIVGIATYNEYVKELKHDRKFLVVNKDHKVTSLHIQSSIFESKNGKAYLYSRRGTVNTLCAKILSKTGTKIFTRDAPIFRDMNVKTVEDKSTSVAGIMLSSDHHEVNELVGQTFVAPETLNVECLYGDIDIPNSSFDTRYLVTDAWEGQTHIYQTPTDHFRETRYVTVSAHLGPLNISQTFNPEESQHPFKIWVVDPVVDLAMNAKNIKGKGQAVSTLVNTADSIVGKLTRDKDGPYTHLVDTTIGASIGYTVNTSRYQTPGNHYVNVGYWDDFSANGIVIENMPANIGVLDMHCGQAVTVNGKTLNYTSSSSTMTVGGCYDILTKQVDISASLSKSSSEGQAAAPCQVQINRLILRKEVEIALNNAQLTVNEVHGKISNLGLFAAQDQSTQTSSTVTASLSGNVGLSQSTVRTKELNSTTFFDAKDLSDCHIEHVTNKGGELRGAGISKISPDTIEETHLVGERHETGTTFSVNVFTGTPQSVGVTTDNTKFMLNMPNNIIHMLGSFKPDAANVDDVFSESNQMIGEDFNVEMPEMIDSSIINDVSDPIIDTDNPAMNVTEVIDESILPEFPVTLYQKPDYRLYEFVGSNSNINTLSPEHTFHLDFPWPEELSFIFGIARTQDSKTDYLYRGDLREPEYIFENGFTAKGNNRDLMRHVKGINGEAPHDSAYISTTTSKNVAKAFPMSIPEDGMTNSYVYVINKRSHAIDVEASLEKMGADPAIYMYDESEFAIKNKVRPRDIKGAYQNIRFFEEGNIGPSHIMHETLIENPYYRPLWTTSDYVLAGLKAGSFLMLTYGAYKDGHDIYDAYLTSRATHSPHPLAREASRVTAAWSGAFLAGETVMPFVVEFTAAAGFAFPVTTAACLVFSVVTSSIGYTIAGEIGKITYDNGVTTATTLLNAGKQLIEKGEFTYRTLRATGQALFKQAPKIQLSPGMIIPLSFH